MKITYLPLVSFFAVLILVSDVFALTNIGDKLKCSGSDILNSKNNKVVKYSKYKSTTQETLARLKDQKGKAAKNKKQGIQDKINAKKEELKSVTLCSKGQLDVGTVDPLFSQLAADGGTFTGQYNGTVTYLPFFNNSPISGDLKYIFTLSGTVFKITIDVGGDIGSTLLNEDLVFEADVGGQALPFEIQIADTFLGTVNMEIKANGEVNIISQDGPDFKGTFAGNQLTGTSTATGYKGGSFSLNYTLNR